MKIDEFLAKKSALQAQLDELGKQLDDIRLDALIEIKKYISEFDISFIQMQQIYESLNLSTATIQVIKPKSSIPDRKGYNYFNSGNRKWFNGYNAIPKWFDLNKADSYLIAVKAHTPLVIQAIKANGLDKKQMKEALTEAQIEDLKDTADQFSRLFHSKKFAVLNDKIIKNHAKGALHIEQVCKYLDKEVADYVFEACEL